MRLVPKQSSPYDEFVALVEREGWEPSEDFSDDLWEWKVPGTHTVVRWVVDGETGAQFFVVEGPQDEQVAKTLEAEIPMLGVDDFESYLAQFASGSGLLRGLASVAAAAPARADPRVIELFETYMHADDPLARRAALIAVSILGWPEFAAPVTSLKADPDPAVRDTAEATLRALGAAS